MRSFAFQVVNVFAESTFGGNPLAVFEDARGLSDAELQAITDQLNLSETTFVFPAEHDGAAKVRIFSPGYEMPFAGHPTLGTGWVLRALRGLGDTFTLELKVGPIALRAQGDRLELQAAPHTWREASPEGLAGMLGLSADQLLPGARWVSTGSEQLIIPLCDVQAVKSVAPRISELLRLAKNEAGRVGAQVFARTADGFHVRYFWEHHGELREDPGTGSACANLGGWWVSHAKPLPLGARVEQGHAVGRLNVLSLRVDEDGRIHVGGRVVALMRGTLELPDEGVA